MDEQLPPSPPPVPAHDPVPVSGDMRSLVVVMGVLLCLAGSFTLCGGAFYGQMMSGIFEEFPAAIAMEGDVGPEEQMLLDQMKRFEPFMGAVMITVVLSSLLTAAACYWLGIGTIRCRRWARKLMQAIGWAWVGMLVLQLVGSLAVLPAMVSVMQGVAQASGGTGGAPVPAFSGVMLLVQVLSSVVQYAIMATPGVILIILFGMRNVRLTCEHHDPVERWTDRVPIEVLPLWVMLVGMALQTVAGLPAWFPLESLAAEFGLDLPGGAGMMLAGSILAIGFCAVSAWYVSKLSPLIWWVLVIATVVGTVLTAYVFQRLDLMAVVDAVVAGLELPPEARDEFATAFTPEMRKLVGEVFRQMWIPLAVVAAGVVGYLAWIKKFFEPPAAVPGLRGPAV